MAHRRSRYGSQGRDPFVLTLRYWLKDQKLDLVFRNHDFFCSQLQFYQLKFAHSIPSLLQCLVNFIALCGPGPLV